MSLENEEPERDLAVLHQAAARCSWHAEAQRDLAWRLVDAKQYERALPHFQRARALNPADPSAWRGLLRSYLMSDGLGEAIVLGENALTQWPGDQEIRFGLAMAYLDHGRQQDASSLFEGLLRDDPEDPIVHAMAGVAYASIGWGAQARREQKDAQRLGRGESVVDRLVAEIDELLGSGV